jgi:hypothetical protein
MPQLNNQTRLTILAHLKNGHKPADISEAMKVSYSTVLKLKRELKEAEERNAVLELFKLDETALEILLEGVKDRLAPIADAFQVGELVTTELDNIKKDVKGGKLLSEKLQDTAFTLAHQVELAALGNANHADTLLILAEALCKIQNAFFTSNNTVAPNLPMSSFEQHLKD